MRMHRPQGMAGRGICPAMWDEAPGTILAVSPVDPPFEGRSVLRGYTKAFMTVREHVVRGAVASEHIVQFFDSDESRVECVAGFLAEGYRAGERAIVVLRPANWAHVFEQLDAQGIPVQRAIDDGMIVVKN